jgi:RNA polymerase sigma factor (sigma-70 family)
MFRRNAMAANSPTPLKADRELTKEGFDRLLVWLDPDRDKAAEKYEYIRIRLTKMFESRGCLSPESLADDTIDRVARRVHEIAQTYEGNPLLYFHGVARMVYLEYLRKPSQSTPMPCSDASEETEQRHDCLEQCLNHLTSRNRELILHYYEGEIDDRREVARRLGISANALRLRVHRIRESLGRCISGCLTMKGLR